MNTLRRNALSNFVSILAVAAGLTGCYVVPIGQDVSSLIFLHALAKPAASQKAYRLIHNFPDAAVLLGWYEILYADGLIENVPIRWFYTGMIYYFITCF